MPNVRGRAKQDMHRAALLCDHIQEHLGWIAIEFEDHVEWSDCLKAAAGTAFTLKEMIQRIAERQP